MLKIRLTIKKGFAIYCVRTPFYAVMKQSYDNRNTNLLISLYYVNCVFGKKIVIILTGATRCTGHIVSCQLDRQRARNHDCLSSTNIIGAVDIIETSGIEVNEKKSGILVRKNSAMDAIWRILEIIFFLAAGLILAIPGWYLICRMLDEVFDRNKKH